MAICCKMACLHHLIFVCQIFYCFCSLFWVHISQLACKVCLRQLSWNDIRLSCSIFPLLWPTLSICIFVDFSWFDLHRISNSWLLAFWIQWLIRNMLVLDQFWWILSQRILLLEFMLSQATLFETLNVTLICNLILKTTHVQILLLLLACTSDRLDFLSRSLRTCLCFAGTSQSSMDILLLVLFSFGWPNNFVIHCL